MNCQVRREEVNGERTIPVVVFGGFKRVDVR